MPATRTIYLPGENGWAEDHGYNGTRLRLKVDAVYDAVSNSSTLTFRVQGKSLAYGQSGGWNFQLRANALLQANGSPLYAGGGDDQHDSGFRLLVNQDETWRTMTDGNGNDATWTTTVTHNDEGTAALTAVFHGVFVFVTGTDKYTMSYYDGQAASASWTEQRTIYYTLHLVHGAYNDLTTVSDGTYYQDGDAVPAGTSLNVMLAMSEGDVITECTVNGVDFTLPGPVVVNSDTTIRVITAHDETPHTVHISKSNRVALSVAVVNSPVSGTSGLISDGSTIYAGDIISIQAFASSGYTLTLKLNGTTLTGDYAQNPYTFLAGGDVYIEATASENGYSSYRLSLDRGSNTILAAVCTERPYDGTGNFVLQNGDLIYTGDTIRLNASGGQRACRLYVNGLIVKEIPPNPTSDNDITHYLTVSGNVVAATEAYGDPVTPPAPAGYRALIWNGSAWV